MTVQHRPPKLEPCRLCGTHLVNVPAFNNHFINSFVHPIETGCILAGLWVNVPRYWGDPQFASDRRRVESWNGRPVLTPEQQYLDPASIVRDAAEIFEDVGKEFLRYKDGDEVIADLLKRIKLAAAK